MSPGPKCTYNVGSLPARLAYRGGARLCGWGAVKAPRFRQPVSILLRGKLCMSLYNRTGWVHRCAGIVVTECHMSEFMRHYEIHFTLRLLFEEWAEISKHMVTARPKRMHFPQLCDR